MDRCRKLSIKLSIKKRDDSLQVCTWLGANVRGRQLFGNLYYCWQVTPEVRWYQVSVSTKDKDHARDEEFRRFRRSSHLEQFTNCHVICDSLPFDVR